MYIQNEMLSVSNPLARRLGLVVKIGYDYDGDMYVIFRDGVAIDSGIICLQDWLERYAERNRA